MSDFTISDRRHSAAPSQRTATTTTPRLTHPAATAALLAGVGGPTITDPAEARRMRNQRTAGHRLGSFSGGGGVNTSLATNRPQDPMYYLEQNNPYDLTKVEDLARLRNLCRSVYRNHSVMASAIDIYSYWPLTGMEFTCKDSQLVDFYGDLFIDTLDYEEFLPSLLHEYWVAGEAFPLGSFNESLGVWDADELLNPDDVFVEKTHFSAAGSPTSLYLRLPQTLRDVIRTGQPAAQYQALMRSYPELAHYASDNAKMPVSNVLLKHIKFKGDNFSPRGVPILNRALRPLMQEEALNSAQDAIADRLYTPLILAKLGATASDLGTTDPWIPTPDQISNFESGLDAALAGDFRIMTTHFAVDIQSVFGRETMPNFDNDFDRLTEKQLQSFGLSKTMLSGGGAGETYAADAMNRDLVSQLLGRAQRYVRKFTRDRMLVVAEAQEHYDYEVRGGIRYPIMEEVLEVDEETGEKYIREQPKLLVPELRLKAMNMKDEATEREFLSQLRGEGVPISQRRRMVNIDLDLTEEIEAVAEEQIEQALEAQRVRKRTYMRFKAEGLPIPEDLRKDFDPTPLTGTPETDPTAPSRIPTLGLDGQDTSALAPTEDVNNHAPGEPLGVPAGPAGEIADQATVHHLPRNRWAEQDGRTRPPESDEMRAGMPRAGNHHAALPEAPVLYTSAHEPVYDTDGQMVRAKPGGLMQGPRHIGMRRHAAKPRPVPDEHEECPA